MKRPIVHFEIGCSNLPETIDFYKKTFDWDIAQHGSSAAIDTGVTGAIPGHLNQLTPPDPQKYVTVYIETDELDKDLEKVVANGGKVFVNPVQLPDGRTFAWFEDTSGNLMGLITPK